MARLVLLELSLRPGAEPDAVAALEAVAGEARQRADCLHYEVYQPVSAARGELAIVQRWASPAAFEAYLASDEFARTKAALDGALASPPVRTVADTE